MAGPPIIDAARFEAVPRVVCVATKLSGACFRAFCRIAMTPRWLRGVLDPDGKARRASSPIASKSD